MYAANGLMLLPFDRWGRDTRHEWL